MLAGQKSLGFFFHLTSSPAFFDILSPSSFSLGFSLIYLILNFYLFLFSFLLDFIFSSFFVEFSKYLAEAFPLPLSCLRPVSCFPPSSPWNLSIYHFSIIGSLSLYLLPSLSLSLPPPVNVHKCLFNIFPPSSPRPFRSSIFSTRINFFL